MRYSHPTAPNLLFRMKQAFQYEKLWESFKEGDRNAFADLYKKYVIILLNYGSKLSGNPAMVEDCIQDLFIDLWQTRNNISSTTSIKFYLFKALRNRIHRCKGSEIHGMDPIEGHLGRLNDSSYEEHIIQMEIESFQMKHLREKVDQLPTRQREAINLRYYHNFSNEEIASLMGISYPAACKFIYAGIKKLIQSVNRGTVALCVGLCFC